MILNQAFWQSASDLCLLNPRFPLAERQLIEKAVEDLGLGSTLWLRSSGTESGSQGIKMVALEKQAILHAAKSVNDFFDVKEEDCWLNPLPKFHIGGLSIAARCFLAGARQADLGEWSPQAFVELIENKNATIASLVPTQVYDLVQAQLPCPDSIRLIVVGGGALRKDLLARVRALGWPISVSYGMTETAALIAASKLDGDDRMLLLPHIRLKAVEFGYAVDSQALFSGYLWFDQGQVRWQPRDSDFVLDDQIELQGDFLSVVGRNSELVKILGETVNLLQLSKRLESRFKKPVCIVAKVESRRGYTLAAFVESEDLGLALEEVNRGLMPYEQIQEIFYLSQFPVTDLGKIDRSALIGNSEQ